MNIRQFFVSTYLLALALFVGGCMTAPTEEPGVQSQSESLSLVPELAFETLVDPLGLGTAPNRAQTTLLATPESYENLFGHAPPSDISFDAGEVALFYAAGIQTSGGYAASVQSIGASLAGLIVTTDLVTPGPTCPVTLAMTTPHALVKFTLPRVVPAQLLATDNLISVRHCSDACAGNVVCGPETDFDEESCSCLPEPAENPCAYTTCAPGLSCISKGGYAFCVPALAQEGTACGAATCLVGTECCNASCGTCVLPGMSCIQIACDLE